MVSLERKAVAVRVSFSRTSGNVYDYEWRKKKTKQREICIVFSVFGESTKANLFKGVNLCWPIGQ